MDWHSVVEFLKTIGSYAATPAVFWSVVVGVAVYFVRPIFDQRREKKKQRNEKNAKELEELHNLAAEVLSSFAPKDDSKTYKSSQIYLERFDNSIIDKSKLNEIKKQNDVLKEIYPQLKPISVPGLWSKEDYEKWEQEEKKRKVIRGKGEAASNTIVELLKAEYKKYV